MAPVTDEKPVDTITVKPFKTGQLLFPVLLGLAAIVWLFLDEFDLTAFSGFRLTFGGIAFIALAFLLMILRDAAQMGRFRLLSGKRLSWRQSFVVNILSEFTCVVTPTVIGGSSLVIFFLKREGINSGRSAAVMFANLLLDGLFFIVVCPALFLVFPLRELFPTAGQGAFGFLFAGLYALQLIWMLILYYLVFVRPDRVKKLVPLLCRLPFVRRRQAALIAAADHLQEASGEIKRSSAAFWMQLFGLTAVAWSARFGVVNAIFAALVPAVHHGVIFARQIILWVFMAVMPTPGGSGTGEWAFKEYYSDVCSPVAVVVLVTLLWRIISHYLYLLLGMMILPRWLEEAFAHKKKKRGLVAIK